MTDDMNAGDEGKITGYMCATDWEYELGENIAGNIIYPSLKAALENLKCGESCGIVKVSVSYVSTALEGTDNHTTPDQQPE